MRLLNLINGSNIWHKILEKRLRMKRVHIGDACSKDEVDNKYSLSETGTVYEYGGSVMATVKEVQLMENEAMVTPVVLINSVKTPDGSSFIESIYPNTEIDAKISKLQNSIKEIASKITVPKRWAAIDQDIFPSVQDICYVNGKFVAVGGGGKIAYSTDGINWTAVADSPFTSKTRIESICYGNEKFIAGGWFTASSGLNNYMPQGRIAYSTDGVNWTKIDSSPFEGYYIYSICYGNGKYVAGGGNPSMTITQNRPGNVPPTTVTIDACAKMAYSTDGITWTEVDSTFGSSRIYSIYHGNGKFVAGGTDGKMASSTDGSNWTGVDSPFGSSGIHSTYYGNGNFIAGGGSGKMAYSLDGITWTAVADSAFGSSTILSICYGNRRYVAVGGEGKMAYCQVGVPE